MFSTRFRHAALMMLTTSLAFAGAARADDAVEAGRARYARAMQELATRHDVPESLIHRIIMRESRYKPHLVSRGNYGLMQIKPGTARGLGFRGAPSELLDGETNMKYAVPYLANAYHIAGRDHDRAVRLYAGGYYYQAKSKGMVAELRTADSPPATYNVHAHSAHVPHAPAYAHDAIRAASAAQTAQIQPASGATAYAPAQAPTQAPGLFAFLYNRGQAANAANAAVEPAPAPEPSKEDIRKSKRAKKDRQKRGLDKDPHNELAVIAQNDASAPALEQAPQTTASTASAPTTPESAAEDTKKGRVKSDRRARKGKTKGKSSAPSAEQPIETAQAQGGEPAPQATPQAAQQPTANPQQQIAAQESAREDSASAKRGERARRGAAQLKQAQKPPRASKDVVKIAEVKKDTRLDNKIAQDNFNANANTQSKPMRK